MTDISAKATNVEIRDPKFRSVVGDRVAFEKIATGFLFTEGPLWHAADKYLLFSDMPGDHLRKWSAQGGVTTFRKPCAQSNGLAWDRQGRLIVCEHATSTVTRTEPDGRSTVIASHHDGKELNSPNDVVVKSDGGIYFTDPTYGRNEYYGNPRPLAARLSRRLSRGAGRRAADPAGGGFRPAQRACASRSTSGELFVNDTDRQHIRVFDVKPDGTLANGRVWAETTGEGAGAPDGMKIDSRRQHLLLRPRRHPRVRARRDLPRRDQRAGVHGQLLLRRRRPPQPLRHRIDLGLPAARAHARDGAVASRVQRH